jgi:alpha-L-arabinofuranosidase
MHVPEPTVTIKADANQALHQVNPLLFGLFLEDINFACEGGLNANLVNNHSFDGVYLDPQAAFAALMGGGPPLTPVYDRLRYWQISGGTLESAQMEPAATKSWYGRVHSMGQARLENLGYNGGMERAGAPAISIVADKEYTFSCWLRALDFEGQISVAIVDNAGQPLTPAGKLIPPAQWQELQLQITGSKTGYGKLVITCEGTGVVDLDCVGFYDADTWNKEDPKWSQGKLRRDLVEVLRDLKPGFLRFPGGSIVDGIAPGNHYRWKDSIGPIIGRTPNYSMWGMSLPDGGYSQSLQIGFYEYFLLSEDLGAEPLPCVWAGLQVQVPGGPTNVVVPAGSPEFEEQVVQNALDLIAYANGDPATNPWARLRAEAGHPAPFNLRYIEIGNENIGEEYLAAFAAVKQAIDGAYPGVTCIMTTGTSVRDVLTMMPGVELPNTGRDLALKRAHEQLGDVLLDEHFYELPEWVLANTKFYDNFPRGGAQVFLGEYAANAPSFRLPGLPAGYLKPNCFVTALAEAAFLTGIERNADIVALTCYAPLFAMAEGSQWEHCLIKYSPGHVLKTANYYVQQMYAAKTGTAVVALEAELPEKVFASATATAGQLILKLVNANAEPVRVKLQLAGVNGDHVIVERLQADDLQATNELRFEGAPIKHVCPQTEDAAIVNGTVLLELPGQSFSVVTADR